MAPFPFLVLLHESKEKAGQNTHQAAQDSHLGSGRSEGRHQGHRERAHKRRDYKTKAQKGRSVALLFFTICHT